MDRDIAAALLDQLHAAQNEFYGGGGDALLRDLLASDIAWTVPGNNSIPGVYRGTEAVFDYFRRRRADMLTVDGHMPSGAPRFTAYSVPIGVSGRHRSGSGGRFRAAYVSLGAARRPGRAASSRWLPGRSLRDPP
jgi:ketosteroid isomerase-like protein